MVEEWSSAVYMWIPDGSAHGRRVRTELRKGDVPHSSECLPQSPVARIMSSAIDERGFNVSEWNKHRRWAAAAGGGRIESGLAPTMRECA